MLECAASLQMMHRQRYSLSCENVYYRLQFYLYVLRFNHWELGSVVGKITMFFNAASRIRRTCVARALDDACSVTAAVTGATLRSFL